MASEGWGPWKMTGFDIATRCPIVGEHSLVRLIVDTSYRSFFLGPMEQLENSWSTTLYGNHSTFIEDHLHTDLAVENAGFHGFSVDFQRVSCDVANRPNDV
jgi:hypothetical protein